MIGLILLVLLLVSFKLYIKLTTGICNSQVCLVGKTAIITGANTGIGFETAIDFAKRGAKVILACRDKTKAQKAVEKIITESHNFNVSYKLLDLSSFASVKQFANDINTNEERLDILVNNAGAINLGDKTTKDGLPSLLQINYFSHFLLTMLLINLMQKHPSRIINVSGTGAKLGTINFATLTSFTSNFNQHVVAKLSQILFTIELAKRYKNTNVTVYSLHPGVIKTEIFRNLPLFAKELIPLIITVFYKTATEGAQTQIYCAIENGLEKFSGEHFHDCARVNRYKSAEDPIIAKKLWEESEKIVGLKSI